MGWYINSVQTCFFVKTRATFFRNIIHIFSIKKTETTFVVYGITLVVYIWIKCGTGGHLIAPCIMVIENDKLHPIENANLGYVVWNPNVDISN